MIDAGSIIGGRYRVVRPVGGGGMKMVYLAEDLRLSARPCALAEMVDTFTDPAMQQQAVAGFQREADMLAQLSNEHIPRVYDRFSEQNHHYLVMEFVEGITLEDALKHAGGKLDESRVIDVALQILDTLEYLHNLQPPVIYRDLKPSNVMIARNEQVKLIDFGIARFFHPQTNATMIGTQGYAPPEQYRGRAEVRSDLYALGATMHHALSGRDPAAEPPFSFPRLRTLCPNLTPALADLVDQALQYDVVHRMVDAGEFKQSLLEIRNGAGAGSGQRKTAQPAKSAAKPQLLLPLGSAPRAQGAAPEAATVIIGAESETHCPRCARTIPADSRFCSFCGADLGRAASVNGAPHVGAEAATSVLPEPSYAPAPHAQTQARYSRDPRPFRFLFFMVAALFLLGLGVTSIVTHLKEDTAVSDREPTAPGQGIAPPPSEAPAPDGKEPIHRTPRAIALRRELDSSGYRSVHFRIDGDTAVLWGTVQSELDRAEVQTMAFAVGIYSLDDHLRVRESDPFASGP